MDTTATVGALIAILGSVLAWMMGRHDRRLDRIDHRLDRVDRSMARFSKAVLLEIVSRPGVSLAIAREGESLLREMQEDRDHGGSA